MLYWVQPTKVKVELEATGETATISASPGHLLPGQRVAVFRTEADGWLATYYVGPLGSAPVREEWPLADPTAVVTIVDHFTKGVWRCEIDGLGTTVLVPKEHLSHAAIGDRLRVAHAGVRPSGEALGQPLTCCLPRQSEESDKKPSGT